MSEWEAGSRQETEWEEKLGPGDLQIFINGQHSLCSIWLVVGGVFGSRDIGRNCMIRGSGRIGNGVVGAEARMRRCSVEVKGVEVCDCDCVDVEVDDMIWGLSLGLRSRRYGVEGRLIWLRIRLLMWMLIWLWVCYRD